MRLKFIKFINRRLLRVAMFWDKRVMKHKDIAFCLLIDEFYLKCELWK